VPNTAAAVQVSGNLIVDPLTVGGDEAGSNMTSDFEWAIVGDPVRGPVPAGLLAEEAAEPAA